MGIKVFLWDTPTNMNRYEGCIREINYPGNIAVFKAEDPKFVDNPRSIVPNILVADITYKKEEKKMRLNILKNKDPNVQIIFIGNKSTALDAWECKCTDYILRPVTKERFKRSILYSIKEIEKEKLYHSSIQVFMIKKGDIMIPLKYDDIIYFEKFNKKIKVKTKKDKYEFYNSFERLRNMIDMDYFIQCHQGFIVNRYKIFSISNDTLYLYESDIPIPMSRRLKKGILDLLGIKNSPQGS